MEHTIPALLIAAIMVLAGVLIAGVTNDSVNTVNESWRAVEAISEERLGTGLTVVSTQVDGSGEQVTMTLGNTGRTAIDDFGLMDVIVNYQAADSQRYINWLSYTESPPQDNAWSVTSISGDYRNPGVFDPGEQMTIDIRLNPATGGGPDRWLVLATDTGVSYTVYF